MCKESTVSDQTCGTPNARPTKWLVAVLLAATVAVLVACGSAAGKGAATGQGSGAGGCTPHRIDVGLSAPVLGGCGQLKIGVFLAGTNNAYLQSNIKAINATAAKAGASVQIFDGKFDPTTQFNQLQAALASGKFNAFLVAAVDGAQSCKILTDQAPARKIIVSVMNQALCGRGANENPELYAPGTLHFVIASSTKQGFTNWLMQVAEENPGPQTVAVLTGPDLNTNTVNTDAAIKAVEQAHPDFHVVATQRTDYSTQQGQAQALPMLRAHPDLTILATNYSDITRGAVAAATQLGMSGKFKIYDAGGNGWAFDAVRQGLITSTLKFAPYQEAENASQALVDAWHGKTVERVTVIPNILVTKGNLPSVQAEY
jgi:ribose transport system substrate-binding protein